MAKSNPTIIAFMLQGQARVILNEDLEEPHQFNSIAEATDWLDENAARHLGLSAADSIVVLDVTTGETDEWL